MTFDRPAFYLTFGGTLYPLASGHEEWQTGLKFAPALGTDPETMQSRLADISITDILAACTKLITGNYPVTMNWSNIVTIDWAKLAVLKTDGHYQGSPVLAEQTGKVGGSGAFPIAPQLAAVVSLWSGETFGRANHGRSYLPVPYMFLNTAQVTEPRATAAAAASLRDVFKLFLADVAGEVDGVTLGTFPAIMSSLANGTTKHITKVGCGRVIDTMRSRRTSLAEDNVWTPYP
jgi:hypothetical protein